MQLAVLAAGASKGLIDALAPRFSDATGIGIRGTFSAVGTIAQRVLAGDACDVIVLTATMLDELARAKSVLTDTIASLGRVRTAIAVRQAEVLPDISSADALRDTLLAAGAVYVPDVERSTAGRHFVKVLNALGIAEAAHARLRSFSSGSVAMLELARSHERNALGCTQVTEIRYTPGVSLVGPLPTEFELATVYAAGVSSGSPEPEAARAFIRLVAGEGSRELRASGGFED